MTRLLCIGECMLELAPAEAPETFRAGFAGDTFNTAWYARRLAPAGLEVAYMTAVGQDTVSERLEVFTRAAGIVPDFIRRPDRTLGLYMIELTEGERSFAYWRGQSAARTLADDLDDLPGIGPGDMVYLSGITLAILPEAGRARLLAALDRARAEGVRVAFDPNLRPRLWPSADVMRAVVMEGARRADIALPSFDDEATWFGDSDIAATADRYATAGARMIAVKDGPRPVLLRTPDGAAWVAPRPVDQIVDSTAAGDAFNAGFLIGLEAGLPPTEAVQQGCDIAAKVVARRGALADI
ncbi:sugar kinase [Roseicyclus mahoneyensis]|uniref:2-keto-3-deoxygluconate kinase n=1 Tax=Roseicyclus mahoneyensis TaxID=164332 RepID=A0A316GGY7_9RHOB|nr:sugar kinase [Roseicyclus mahoneyensis]PWK59206.1 2-keto-3-deoxygluconate kinase [Roseicyclus mahoneyensis]